MRFTRKVRGALLSAAALTLVTGGLSIAPAAAANPTPPFTECPAIGADTSCGILIVVGTGGAITVLQDNTQGPYDGSEDTLVGILNNSGAPLSSVHLASSTTFPFGFDNDGICTFQALPYCATAPTGYEGPGNTFSNIAGGGASGDVNFAPALADGASGYFSLEDALTAADLGPGGQTISGTKYYDANANGQFDPGEAVLPNWLVNLSSPSGTMTVPTDGTGVYTATIPPDTWTVAEQQGGGTWKQTGNLVDQSSGTGAVTLHADKTYTDVIAAGQSSTGLNFGNLCLGAGGALSKGFWTNKNGAKLFATNSAGALALLDGLNLRNENGTNFDPTTYQQLAQWLSKARSVNAAYMLSAQLAAMELNVFFGKVNPSALIFAPGTTSANANGFASVSAVMSEANTNLGANPVTLSGSAARPSQQKLESALDDANNNKTFVQATPATCPAPVFASTASGIVDFTADSVARHVSFNVHAASTLGPAGGTLNYSDANGNTYTVAVDCVVISSANTAFFSGPVTASNFGVPIPGTWLTAKVLDNSPDQVWGTFVSSDPCATLGAADPADGPFNVTAGDLVVFKAA